MEFTDFVSRFVELVAFVQMPSVFRQQLFVQQLVNSYVWFQFEMKKCINN